MPVAPPNPPPSVALALLGLLGLIVISGTLTAWVGVLLRLLGRPRPLWPPARPRVVPWHGGTILGVVLLYVILSTAVATGARALRGPAPAPAEATAPSAEERSPRERLGLQAVINIAVLAMVPWFVRRTTRASQEDLGLADRDWRANLKRGALTFFLIGVPVYAIMRLSLAIWPRTAHPVETMLEQQLDTGTAALAIVSAVVLAPVVEELLFRGLLLGWLQRVFDPASVAVVPEVSMNSDLAEERDEAEYLVPVPGWFRFLPDLITAALFAALHLGQWPAPVPLFVLALVLGALVRQTGSLWAPIGLHAMFNGVSTLGMLLATSAGVHIGPEEDRPIPAPAQVIVCEDVAQFSILPEFPRRGDPTASAN